MRDTRRRERGWIGLATALALGACGGDDGVDVDPAIAPFVGTWDAVVYEIWPQSNPQFVIDVLTAFGPFYIIVEPSGQYQAVLEALPPQIQFGVLSVVGATIRLDVTSPPNEPPATGSYAFMSDDYLLLDGEAEIDFNNDGVRDPTGTHIELQRRP
jgi:hypothetical protein